MASDYAELVPHAIAQEIIGAITDEESALMALATVARMPSGVETVPVLPPVGAMRVKATAASPSGPLPEREAAGGR